MAVENKNIEIIKLLLTNDNLDININNKTQFGYKKENESYKYYNIKTALCLAVKKYNASIVELLLTNKNINVNIKEQYYIFEKEERTPLYLAVERETIEIIKLLLNCSNLDINILSKTYKSSGGAEISNKYFFEKTALYLAIENKSIKIVKLLLTDSRIDVNTLNKYNYKEFQQFCSWKEQIKTGEDEKTALYLAVEKRIIDFVKLLLTNDKINVNIPYIYKAQDENIRYGNFTEYKKTEEKSETALYFATKFGNIDIVKLLLTNKNVDVNVLNNYYCIEKQFEKDDKVQDEKKSSLHVACENENIDMIKTLLANKYIDVNIKDKQGKKPIDYTITSEIKKLLKH